MYECKYKVEADMSSAGTRKTDKDQDYALVLLVKEILGQVDEFYALRKTGAEGALSLAMLKEMCSVLPELEDDLRERYFDILITIGSNVERIRPTSTSEDMAVASVEPKRRTLGQIAQALGLKAA